MAELLPRELAATVIATSPAIALALGERPDIEVVLAGGRFLRRTGTVTGPDAVQTLRAVRADLCFLGVCSLDAAVGITCAERDEIFVKRAVIEGAGEVVALATADKLDAVAAHVVAPATEINRLVVTDAVPEARARTRMRSGGSNRACALSQVVGPVPAAPSLRGKTHLRNRHSLLLLRCPRPPRRVRHLLPHGFLGAN